jgi:Spy/CpxP family protein refolding chaperone
MIFTFKFEKKMKRNLFLMIAAALLLGCQLNVSAQNKIRKQRPTPEQTQQRQCNQMVKTLLLDDATAAKFIPLFSKYLEEMRAVRQSYRDDRTLANKPMPTDAEIEKLIKDRFARSRKMLDLRENYYGQFRKILSPKQIWKMYQTEDQNAKKIKRVLKNRKANKRMQQGRPGAKNQNPS